MKPPKSSKTLVRPALQKAKTRRDVLCVSHTCSLSPAYLSLTCGHGLIDLSYSPAREARSTSQRADLIRSIDLQQVRVCSEFPQHRHKKHYLFLCSFQLIRHIQEPKQASLGCHRFYFMQVPLFVVNTLCKSLKS